MQQYHPKNYVMNSYFWIFNLMISVNCPPARRKAVKFGLDFYLIQNKALALCMVEIEYDGVKTELSFELSISYEL